MKAEYTILRFYRDITKKDIVKQHLTLEEAMEHCQNPETNSATCTSEEGIARTNEFGPWFEGYTKDH